MSTDLALASSQRVDEWATTSMSEGQQLLVVMVVVDDDDDADEKRIRMAGEMSGW